MREVVNSLQMSVMRYNLGSGGDYPASQNEQNLIQQVEQLKLQLSNASERSQKVQITTSFMSILLDRYDFGFYIRRCANLAK